MSHLIIKYMDVILVFNGLGNQMSQYAFYLAKKRWNENVKCIFATNSYNPHNGSELERIFGISYEKSLTTRFLTLIYGYKSRPKIWKVLKFLLRIREIRESYNYDYDESKLKSCSKYCITFYWGGWHSEKYYTDIVEMLKKTYSFTLPYNPINQPFIDSIKTTQSVSLHIRRGDYLKYKEYGEVTTIDYYRRAIGYIRERINNPVFYIFSNDINWCRNNFNGDEYYFIDNNSRQNAWQDMLLMSMCKHHINANSTFSWWAAWLSENNGIIIVPKRFILNTMTKDIYPEKWIKL